MNKPELLEFNIFFSLTVPPARSVPFAVFLETL